MTETCSLETEKKKSVEGFYTNLKFPDSQQATHSNSTTHIVGSRDVMNRRNEITRIMSNMTNISDKIGSLNTKQRQYREKTGNTILSQHDSMVYDKHDNAVIDGLDTPSYLIKQLQTGGVEECKRSCDTNKDCGGFSYWSGNNTCSMKEMSILPNPPIQRYSRSLLGDVWNGQYNAATNTYLTNKGKMSSTNRGGVTTVELTPEEKQRLATSFMDTSDFCDGEKIYVDANSEQIKQTVADEGHCAKACEGDANCDMYLMSDANTCHTYKNVSNVSAFCKSGGNHTSWGNLKKNMSNKIVRYPQTGTPEGFSLFGGSTEPVVEGFWGSIWKEMKKVAKEIAPPPPKCSINIVGECPSHSTLANAGWFNDRDRTTSNGDRGNLWTTSNKCSERRNRWESDCRAGDNNNVGVYNYYVPSKKNQSAPRNPPPQHTWTTYVKKTTEGFQSGDVDVPYTKMGPYKDEWKRALPDYKGTDRSANSVETCSKKCDSYNYFGVQDGGQCFCGNDWDKATKYGASNCGEKGGGWCNYIYKNTDPNSNENWQAEHERRRTHNELDANVREYARNVDQLKKYNLDLDTMAEGNSEAMDKAIAEYRANIAIVAENRENKTWIHDKNIVGITELTRKSRAYIYMLWGVLAVIVLILLLRNAM
jgi:hypothetical protein